MKQLKRIASLLLVTALLLTLSVGAFAAGGQENLTNGKITINNATVGETYTIYQIFDLVSYNDTTPDTSNDGLYSYKVTDAWANFIEQENVKGKFVTVNYDGYIEWVEDASAAEFAKLAKTYAATLNANQGQIKATTTEVKFENLDLGYYLIDTTLGTICSLDTTNPDVTVREKNEAPTSDKKVEEDSNPNVFGETNDADFNQTVNFKSEIGVKDGAVNYKFRDTMSAGLTLDATSIKVTVDGTDVSSNCTINTTNVAPYTFTIAFDNTWIATQSGKTIVITYSATLNENAVVGGNGNTNTADLEYGNKPESERDTTPDDTTTTYTWEFDVFKHTASNTALAGAEFKLYKTVSGATKYAVITNGKLTRWVETEADGTTLVSGADGKITIDGLDADTYFLKEIKAPNGYNLLKDPIEVKIDNNGKVYLVTKGEGDAKVETEQTDKVIEIQNNTGAELPETGGMGTTLFYTVGAILVLAAVVLLVTKKRMAAAN